MSSFIKVKRVSEKVYIAFHLKTYMKNSPIRVWKIVAVVALIVFLLIVIVFLLQKTFFSGSENILFDQLNSNQSANVLAVLKYQNISGFILTEGRAHNEEINDVKHTIAYVEFKTNNERRNYVIDLDSSEILISSITHYFNKEIKK